MSAALASPSQRPAAAFSLTVKDGIAELLFDLPGEKVNLLSAAVMEELNQNVVELSLRSDIRCLVVKSGKPGIFIAGANLNEFAAITEEKAAAQKAGEGQAVFNALADLPFPTIAAIHGAAAGGGLELALACDYRVVTDDPRTKLSLPETTIGILPGFGGSYRLPRVIGLSAALRMILTGTPVDGPRAEKIGLADACWPSAFFDDRILQMARAIAAGKPPRQRRRRKSLGITLAEKTPFGRALLFRAARREVLSRTRGHYPAPLAALRVLRKTVHASRAGALAAERETIGKLLPTDITRNLVGLFFAQEAAKRPAALLPGAALKKVERAAVLGAGVMGGRIAWLFAKQGVPVVVKDIAWEAVRKGFETAHDIFRELEGKRRGSPRETNLGMNRISGAVDYKGLGSPDLVIEAVVENLEVKKKVLAEVEEHVRPDTLIASNTSSLSITEMAASLRRPERFVGMHFFNPPNRMPLVEVVPGARSSSQAVSDAVRTVLALGKTPIVVHDCPGFLVNRLLMPYLNECVRLVEEGGDFVAVDRLFVDFGMPMGPFTLLDEIGVDVAREVGRVLSRAYGNRMEASAVIESLGMRPDLLGKKTGKGFYIHGSRKRIPNPEMRRLILGTGFPPFRGGLLRWADSRGIGVIRETLAGFARGHGQRFAPAPLLVALASEGRGFYQG